MVKRYSELLTFSKALQHEMKNYLKRNGFAHNSVPLFPPKKFFFAKTRGFIDARVKSVNVYF